MSWRKALCCQRRVSEPAHIRRRTHAVKPVASKVTEVQQQTPKRRDPEAERIQPRKRHIARPNHQWDKVVAKAEQNRHADEENHRRAMHRKHSVEDLVRAKMMVWNGKLSPYHHP